MSRKGSKCSNGRPSAATSRCTTWRDALDTLITWAKVEDTSFQHRTMGIQRTPTNTAAKKQGRKSFTEDTAGRESDLDRAEYFVKGLASDDVGELVDESRADCVATPVAASVVFSATSGATSSRAKPVVRSPACGRTSSTRKQGRQPAASEQPHVKAEPCSDSAIHAFGDSSECGGGDAAIALEESSARFCLQVARKTKWNDACRGPFWRHRLPQQISMRTQMEMLRFRQAACAS